MLTKYMTYRDTTSHETGIKAAGAAFPAANETFGIVSVIQLPSPAVAWGLGNERSLVIAHSAVDPSIIRCSLTECCLLFTVYYVH